ncbi:MAG: site-2 protease family protein [Firmicutes bacterium]|nr:site-2 protease family protein [Bacillota bacterium]
MQSALWAILGIGLMMFVHELGHYLGGRANGIKVVEFALGFGPKLFSFRRGETMFSVRLIPVWAYAAMEERTDPPGRGFLEKSVLQRMSVMIAGPAMSLLLAAVLFTLIFSAIGTPHPTTVIEEVMAGYPAEAAGIRKGDRIAAINDKPVNSWQDIVSAFQGSAGIRTRVTLLRDGLTVHSDVVPVKGDGGRGIVGIRPVLEMRTEGIVQAIGDGFKQTLWVSSAWVRQLASIVMGKAKLEIVSAVGIGQMIGEASRNSLGDALFLIAVFSAVVGLGSLLPLPGFDGGRLLFLAIEAVRGRPVDPDKENLFHFIGFAVLLALGIVIILRDIQRLMG